MDPTPGWGLGNAAPAPAGTSAVLVGAGAATATLLGITMVDTATSPPMAPRIQDVCQARAAVVLLRDERLGKLKVAASRSNTGSKHEISLKQQL